MTPKGAVVRPVWGQFILGCQVNLALFALFLAAGVVYVFWYPGDAVSLDVRQVYTSQLGGEGRTEWILYQDPDNYLVVRLPNAKIAAGARLDSLKDQIELSGALEGEYYDHSAREDSAQLRIVQPGQHPEQPLAFTLQAPMFVAEGFKKVGLDLEVRVKQSSKPAQLELAHHQ